MIEFNDNDFNIEKISVDSKLFNLVTIYPYRVYGLKQGDNPLVLIEFNSNVVDSDFMDRLNDLDKFFMANGIDFVAEDTEEGNKVFVGLRKDIRKHVVLSSSILQTIVYCLENRLNLKKEIKIPGIPKFASDKAKEDKAKKEKKEKEKEKELVEANNATPSTEPVDNISFLDRLVPMRLTPRAERLINDNINHMNNIFSTSTEPSYF
jgi:hypothetical protein